MNFEIRYVSEYRYAQPVVDNLNALRVKPGTTATQRCDDFQVLIEPGAKLHRYTDYFGTGVVEFGISEPHERLSIDVHARVATDAPPSPPEAGWAALDTPAYEAAAAEFLLQVEQMPADGTVGELLASAAATTPLEALLAVVDLVPDRFEYRPGVSYVGSTTADLLAGGAGVCQDFVHLALMLLRARGIAARYVSGYLFAADGEGGADSVEVNTHAWVEALLPSAGGSPAWVGADPTNRGLADERHVKIGHGRHYADVPPVKGVYRGTPDATLDARVQMRRVDPAAAAAASAA